MILTEQELQVFQGIEENQSLSIQLLDNIVKLSHPELIKKAPIELEGNIQNMQGNLTPSGKSKGRRA